MTVRYLIKLEPDDDDTLLVTCPATFGEDKADAVRRARDAIEEALAARIGDGMDIPALASRSRARAVALPLMAALKVALYRSLREAGLTRAELMRRLGWNRESVDRLFRLDHASRLDQLEAAFKALGRSVDVSIKRAA
jgi:antitoxin HicB